jgi:hypothetical protein
MRQIKKQIEERKRLESEKRRAQNIKMNKKSKGSLKSNLLSKNLKVNSLNFTFQDKRNTAVHQGST